MMKLRTKIVCTIGPAVNTLEKILELMEAGMSVARLNFSHGTHAEHLYTIELLKAARLKACRPLAIMLDTKGPEIRIGKLKGKAWTVDKGTRLTLVAAEREEDFGRLPITPSTILDVLQPGMAVLFDNGYIISHVVERTPEGVVIEIENQGVLASTKGVNIPKANFRLPAMTEQDILDIKFGCQNDVDLIAASFICSAEHVLSIKRLLYAEGKESTLVIAKIENTQGIEDLDNIIQVSDGIMIARGDLGVEVPISEVPRLQKMMIRKCFQEGKPVITATQMLESMIHKPRPTRAEASDVANAIYDSTSAVMLSGETAVGAYPIETVEIMKSIALESEGDFDYAHFFSFYVSKIYHDVNSAIAAAAVHTAYNIEAAALFIVTTSGISARLMSRLRPQMPIIALTSNLKVYNQMAVNWGVIPLYEENLSNSDQCFEIMTRFALEKGYVHYGNQVIMVTGHPFGIPGTTNTMVVKNIGDVLVRGTQGWGEPVYGAIALGNNLNRDQAMLAHDKILVLTKCDESSLPFMQKAKGVILQNHIDDHSSEEYLKLMAEQLSLSILIRVESPYNILQDGQVVTLDPVHKFVYNGIIDMRVK